MFKSTVIIIMYLALWPSTSSLDGALKIKMENSIFNLWKILLSEYEYIWSLWVGDHFYSHLHNAYRVPKIFIDAIPSPAVCFISSGHTTPKY